LPSGAPGGSTTVAAVIGDPVRHSRSPAILNAAFAAAGLDWTFAAFEVPRGRGAEAAAAVRSLGLGGLSVTMPHKQEVIASLDRLTGDAEALGAVNCIERDGETLVGHNTDGAGFLAGLAAEEFDPSGARCVVLGAGGASRAVVLALAGAGAAEVVVVNRTPDKALVAAALAGRAGRTAGPESLGDALASADLLVNATPVGMADGDQSPVDPSLIRPALVVSDLVYHPADTPLMESARQAGAKAHNGLGMLVGQAAVAFGIWTGGQAPVAEMARAAVEPPEN